MGVKAAKGAVLHFRAKGHDARLALAALRELVALDFHEDETDHPDGEAGRAHG
jgi:phosphocarrier protein HPr